MGGKNTDTKKKKITKKNAISEEFLKLFTRNFEKRGCLKKKMLALFFCK